MLNKRFSKNDSGFICENCGKVVTSLTYSSRNHCPHCLYSKHVDNNPGDRENTCHGLMRPIAASESPKKGYVITFRCQNCGAEKNNKSAKDDNFDVLLGVMRDR